jgi:hypothetical protein
MTSDAKLTEALDAFCKRAIEGNEMNPTGLRWEGFDHDTRNLWKDKFLGPLFAAAKVLTAPETVTTAEELDALPYGSAILDVYGAVRVKGRAHSNFSGGWAMVGKDSCPMHLLVNGKPFTVLHIGGK